MAKGRKNPDPASQSWSRHVTLLLEEMQQRRFVAYRSTGTWQPATNVYETEDRYLVCVDLSGVDADSVAIECRDSMRLLIRGHRAQPRPEEPCCGISIHVMEIDEGPFFREIDLPKPIDGRAIRVRYQRGFLWLTLPIRAN
ncbi:MAG: Hsp20/alpha crystallin family protein [Phycisphaerae bacterium]